MEPPLVGKNFRWSFRTPRLSFGMLFCHICARVSRTQRRLLVTLCDTESIWKYSGCCKSGFLIVGPTWIVDIMGQVPDKSQMETLFHGIYTEHISSYPAGKRQLKLVPYLMFVS